MNIVPSPIISQSRQGFEFTPSTGGMDVVRPPQHARRRRFRRFLLGALAVLLLGGSPTPSPG